MNLKEYKESKQNDIRDYTLEADKAARLLIKLKSCTQPSTSIMHANITDYCTVSIKENAEYTFILGGDGRSQPWSEVRKGIVVTVKIADNIYLNDLQLQAVKDYVINTNPRANFVDLIPYV